MATRLVQACLELLGHGIVMTVMLIMFRGIELVVHILWGTERKLYGFLPFSYMIDTADLLIFWSLLYCGISAAVRAYRGETE